jgi:hypothetical protein
LSSTTAWRPTFNPGSYTENITASFKLEVLSFPNDFSC